MDIVALTCSEAESYKVNLFQGLLLRAAKLNSPKEFLGQCDV